MALAFDKHRVSRIALVDRVAGGGIFRSRVQLSRSSAAATEHRLPIPKGWLVRFRKRYPDIQGVWTRQIENARRKIASVEIVKPWFEAVTELQYQH